MHAKPAAGRSGWSPAARATKPKPKGSTQVHFAKRKKFETRAGSAPRSMLNFLTSRNLTKMAVVKLRQRKRPLRG
jgi:hypothetical protein